jgi:hypothetical protein
MEQITALRDEVKALHKASAVTDLREQETVALVASLQKENEQLRQAEIDESLEEDSNASSGAEDKQIAGHAKPLKRPRR